MPINPNYTPAAGDGAHYNDDGSFSYPDGTVATLDEINAGRKSKGLPPLGIGDEAGREARSGAHTGDALHPNNVPLPQHTGPDAPGTSLNTSNSDEDRSEMSSLLQHLQQQAASGGGAWEAALKANTDKANASAMALGQSQANEGGSIQSALRNVGNAKAGNDQRAVGQANELRAKSKLDANNQIGGLLDNQGQQDIQQAGSSSDAAYGLRALNAASQQGAKEQSAAAGQRDANTVQTGLSILGTVAALSRGGGVPGRPMVAGDDRKNDTVPAMLSPGEIVIPRSHADSPESAAAFVRSLQASRGRVQHFDGGGNVQPQYQGWDPTKPGFDLFHGNNTAAGKPPPPTNQEDPSLENGGMLNTGQFGENRANTIQNNRLLSARADGTADSQAPQQFQNNLDSNIAAAMQSSGNRRGPGAGDIMQVTSAANQAGAGEGAKAVAGEQSAGQAAFARSLANQRARDQAMALAQQQAAFRNTQLNSGVGLQNMALMSSIANANSTRLTQQLSGAAQGMAAYTSASGGVPKSESGPAPSGDQSNYDNVQLAHGGRIGYADGGSVSITPGVPQITRVPQHDVDVTVGEPVINSREAPIPESEFLKAYARSTPAQTVDEEKAQAAREGAVWLQNTLPGGKSERGQMVARNKFKTDADFDSFVAGQKQQGNLWDSATPQPPPPGIFDGMKGAAQRGAALLFGPRASLDEHPQSDDESRRAAEFVAALKRRKVA